MVRKSFIIFTFIILFVGIIIIGCDKERIVESTEIIHDIEYVTVPADTVFKIDTVFKLDTTASTIVDTVIINNPANTTDTIILNDTTFITTTDSIIMIDTIIQTINNFDTLIITDTINTTEYVYDTISVTDTIQISQDIPNEFLAFTALQYYSDQLVIEQTTIDYGLTSGYIFYLSAYQHSTTQLSSTVYDIYGYIDYWSTDWSAFYAYEYNWRMTYTGGDPANHANWQISDPPAFSSPNPPGLNLIQKNEDANLLK